MNENNDFLNELDNLTNNMKTAAENTDDVQMIAPGNGKRKIFANKKANIALIVTGIVVLVATLGAYIWTLVA